MSATKSLLVHLVCAIDAPAAHPGLLAKVELSRSIAVCKSENVAPAGLGLDRKHRHHRCATQQLAKVKIFG
ncbi:MAG TPA: hypothetical protein VFD66_10190 [Verrucomicrobiae bacterium]|nr:hypothetical protein [Verrucomicrobiae bacterium]